MINYIKNIFSYVMSEIKRVNTKEKENSVNEKPIKYNVVSRQIKRNSITRRRLNALSPVTIGKAGTRAGRFNKY